MKSSALDAPGANGPLTLSGPVPLPERILHTGDQISAPQATDKTVTPVADDLDFDDIILVFPPESGLKPLYVMYRSPRNMPGTVSGKGQNVGNNWMGGPVPGMVLLFLPRLRINYAGRLSVVLILPVGRSGKRLLTILH